MQMQVLDQPQPEAQPRPRTPDQPVPPQHRRSRLGQATVSLGALAVGVLGMVDLSGVDIAGSAYFAVPLSVVGLGLLAGAWFGRARWLIAIGAVLTALLAIAAGVEAVGPVDGTMGGTVTWRPASIELLDSGYRVDVGNATLDLTGVSFTGQEKSVQVDVGAGNLTVIVPSDVDVRTEATVGVGNANVFGTRWGGIGQTDRTIVDDGADGPGGGTLVIRATVDVGNLEVRR